MSITIAEFTDTAGNAASIDVEKDSKLYRLTIGIPCGDGLFSPVFTGTYKTMVGAVRAMERAFPAAWTRTDNNKRRM